MQPIKKYPALKVIVGFSLCPMLAGELFFFRQFIPVLFTTKEEISSLFPSFRLFIIYILSFAIGAEILCCIPAFFLAIFIAKIKLKKGIFSIFFISIMGGLAASSWGLAAFPFDIKDDLVFGDMPIKNLFNTFKNFFNTFYFLLGSISCLIMSILILPKRTAQSAPKDGNKQARMQPIKKYPTLKVIVGFSLCPMLAGALFFFMELFLLFLQQKGGISSVFPHFYFFFIYILLFVIWAEFFCCIPAFFLAIFIAKIKLKKGIFSIFFISIMGGLAASSWGLAAIPLGMENDLVFREFGEISIKYFFNTNFFNTCYFLLGSISCLIMSILILPKRTAQSAPKDGNKQ